MRSKVEAGQVYVPKCRRCDPPRVVVEATMLTDEDQDARLVISKDQGKRLMGSMLWKVFVNVLDTIRVKTAAGTFSNMFCIACEMEPHNVEGYCKCPCHDAWEYRSEAEGMK